MLESKTAEERIEDLLVQAETNGMRIKKLLVSRSVFDQLASMARIVSLHPRVITFGAPPYPKKLKLNWVGGTVTIKPYD